MAPRKPRQPDLLERMVEGAIGACSCRTTQPQISSHHPLCRWRLLSEAALEIQHLRAQLAKARDDG